MVASALGLRVVVVVDSLCGRGMVRVEMLSVWGLVDVLQL